MCPDRLELLRRDRKSSDTPQLPDESSTSQTHHFSRRFRLLKLVVPTLLFPKSSTKKCFIKNSRKIIYPPCRHSNYVKNGKRNMNIQHFWSWVITFSFPVDNCFAAATEPFSRCPFPSSIHLRRNSKRLRNIKIFWIFRCPIYNQVVSATLPGVQVWQYNHFSKVSVSQKLSSEVVEKTTNFEHPETRANPTRLLTALPVSFWQWLDFCVWNNM